MAKSAKKTTPKKVSGPAPGSAGRKLQQIAKPDPEGFERKYHHKETLANGAQRWYFNNAEGIECVKIIPATKRNAKRMQEKQEDGTIKLVPIEE